MSIWLFGSRARGEAPQEFSDVDVIVVTRDERRDRRLVSDLAWQAAEVEGMNPFQLAAHVRDPEWVDERRAIESFFMREVDRDKIVLLGSP